MKRLWPRAALHTLRIITPISEMWLIREGTVEITVNGMSHQLGAGSVGFVRSNDEHGIRNAGATPTVYFVVAIGPGADA